MPRISPKALLHKTHALKSHPGVEVGSWQVGSLTSHTWYGLTCLILNKRRKYLKMHARITRFKIRPEALNTVVEGLPEVRNAIGKIAGGVANYALWNDDGTGVAIAIYESESFADAARDQIEAIWAGMSQAMLEPPVFDSYTHAENLR